jgi:hypothetical protein
LPWDPNSMLRAMVGKHSSEGPLSVLDCATFRSAGVAAGTFCDGYVARHAARGGGCVCVCSCV